jgi:hypothetical protein
MTLHPFRIGYMTPAGDGLVAIETFPTLESALQRACTYLDDAAATEIWIEDGEHRNVADFTAITAYRDARGTPPAS